MNQWAVTIHYPLAPPSGELSSGCETERVCVAAFARRPWMLLLSVLSMPSPQGGKPSVETGSGIVEGSILALSVFAAQIHLSQRERLWQYGKASGFAKGSPFGGAVTAGD